MYIAKSSKSAVLSFGIWQLGLQQNANYVDDNLLCSQNGVDGAHHKALAAQLFFGLPRLGQLPVLVSVEGSKERGLLQISFSCADRSMHDVHFRFGSTSLRTPWALRKNSLPAPLPLESGFVSYVGSFIYLSVCPRRMFMFPP